MSDSGSKNLSVAAGVGLAAAGLIVGLAGPSVVKRVVLTLKPGGKFSGVSSRSYSSPPRAEGASFPDYCTTNSRVIHRKQGNRPPADLPST